nr:hypothetical protein GCM10020063_009630 [Dactylosporangium thailandense]
MVAWPDGTAMALPENDRADVDDPAPTRVGAQWPEAGLGRAASGADAMGRVLAQQLRQVARRAAAVAGAVPGAVTVVVPAESGALQLPVVRRAAAAAGFGVVEVLPAAVAVGWHLLAGGVRLEPGAVLLVCTVDAECAATVLHRTPEGFAVLSSVTETTVAADMPAPGMHAVAPADGMVREVLRRALAGAQLAPGMVDLVCAVGENADAAVGRDLAVVCGVEPWLVAEPRFAALLGAVQRGPAGGGGPASAVRRAGWRDGAAVLLPAVWSMALFGQFLAGSQRYGPREKLFTPGMLLASWGGLAFAAVFGLVALVGGLLLATELRHDAADDGEDGPGMAGLGWVRHRLQALALAGGALGGLALAAIYSLVAAGYFDLELGPLLRWSVLPVLPAAVAVVGLAVVVWQRPHPPGGSWPAWLRFPPLTVLVAGAGALLISFDETGQPRLLQALAWQLYQWAPSGHMTIIGPVGRLGGVCVGVAVALLIVRRPLARLLLGAALAVVVGVSLAWRVTGTVAVGFALAVAGWWAARAAWLVLRPLLLRPPGTTGREPPVLPAATTPVPTEPGGGWGGDGHVPHGGSGWPAASRDTDPGGWGSGEAMR